MNPCSLLRCFGVVLAALPWAACGGGGASGGGPPGVLGGLHEAPSGKSYFLDDHRGGHRTRLHLVEVFWGRLVDVYSLDAEGEPEALPFLEELVVNENVISDGVNYELRSHPVTQREQLVILRERDGGAGEVEFETLLHRAKSDLPGLVPLADDATVGGPFTLVPRNAALLLHFDDLLADDPESARRLTQTVHVLAGSPPTVHHGARILFDPNHGGLAGGVFHSTRLIVDPTISEFEALTLDPPLPIEPRGFPASRVDVVAASGVIRMPTQLDEHAGQFERLVNLDGHPLDELGNGPVDGTAPSHSILRGFRTGNREDANNGYLLDVQRPSLLGDWRLSITGARDDPAGSPRKDFLVDLAFGSPCRKRPERGDVLLLGSDLLEVVERATPPDGDGAVAGVRVRLVLGERLAASLPGTGLFVTRHDPLISVSPACWVTFTPPSPTASGAPPGTGLPAELLIRARFDEALEPDSVRAFDSFRLVRGTSTSLAVPLGTDLVVGEVVDGADLQTFLFRPAAPLSTDQGGEFFFELGDEGGGVTDLSGNGLFTPVPRVDLRLDAAELSRPNRSIVMRFNSLDELLPLGLTDLRGQIFVDPVRGVAISRPAVFTSYPVDRGNIIPRLMQPFPPGLQTPLTPLGSRLMTLWRHVDVGWRVTDESKYNMDVVGMSWSPVGGSVLADFFPEFEMRLAHSQRLPDEWGGVLNGALFPNSGLLNGSFPFATNLLGQDEAVLQTMHSRELGYRILPSDVFANSNGTPLVPFPWNRSSGPFTSFTWRDTAETGRGGNSGAGVPMVVEVRPPANLEPETGTFALPGSVPSVGLPLLWEIRTFPTSSGLGLNPLDVALGAPRGWPTPRFRVFSSGGVDITGNVVTKDPDLETHPTGGFNARSNPPGQPTAFTGDPVFYMGQLETFVRLSRGYTAWIDAGGPSSFRPPVLEPAPDEQPPGTRVDLSYRGAHGFFTSDPLAPFDAQRLSVYGELGASQVDFSLGHGGWTEDLDELAGARYLQMRLTFVSDPGTQRQPELTSLGVVALSGVDPAGR